MTEKKAEKPVEKKAEKPVGTPEPAKYRVTYRSFKEYVSTGVHLTNVHTVRECDVVALDAPGAINQAAVAFGVLTEDTCGSGDWKVRMLRFPQEVMTVGSGPQESTLISLSRMGV